MLPQPSLAGGVPRVLVVDDDDVIRHVLRDALTDEGYAVACAANGQEALAQLDQHGADLVLLDMQMPVLDGPACFAALRQRAAPPKVILIAAATRALAAAHALGADAAVAKPFDLEEVLALVVLVLSRPAAQGAAA